MTPYPGELKCFDPGQQDDDEACTCANCVKSGFNFWLSNSRICIGEAMRKIKFMRCHNSFDCAAECAFGMLTRRFGILRKDLEVGHDFCKDLISACCIIHNLCIDDRLKNCKAKTYRRRITDADMPEASTYVSMQDYVDRTNAEFPFACATIRNVLARESQQGKRNDRKMKIKILTRDILARWLSAAAYTRPKK